MDLEFILDEDGYHSSNNWQSGADEANFNPHRPNVKEKKTMGGVRE